MIDLLPTEHIVSGPFPPASVPGRTLAQTARLRRSLHNAEGDPSSGDSRRFGPGWKGYHFCGRHKVEAAETVGAIIAAAMAGGTAARP